jgi:phenylpyruvate tautomerase PptA (4-oxalocrotonate tautomerase family)
MPTTLISIRKQRSPEERHAMVEAVQAALVEGIKIPAADRDVRLQSFAPEDFITGHNRGDNFTLVEVSLFSGRSLDAKRALYQALVRHLGAFGIAALEIKVILYEVPRENWGLRGGIPGSEIDLGFKVDV